MRHYFLAFVVAVFVAGCKPSMEPVKVADNAVRAETPTKKSMRHVIEQPASVEAFEDAHLVARIPGYVHKVVKDIGDEVKPGDLLAELSAPELVKEHAQKQALVTQAKAEVDQAKAMVGEADANIVRADANVERWESEYRRVDGLFKSRVVEKQILDETLHQYQSAKAGRLEATAKHDKAKADVAVAKARVQVADAEEGRLKALADYRFIVAPLAGVVTRRNIHTGYFLQPNASGGPGVLFVVAQIDKLRIVADIPEAEAMYITDSLKGAGKLQATIQVPTLTDQTFEGNMVARTSQALDAKSRTLRVEIDYLNTGKKLRPGMYANLLFDIELKDRYSVPASAIFTHADLPCCWRVVEGKAVRTPLKLGVRDGQRVEVLRKRIDSATWEPIDGAEQIIVTNLGVVSEGKQVKLERK